MSKTNNEPMQPEAQTGESLKLDVTVRPIAPMGNLLAYANVTIGTVSRLTASASAPVKTACMSTCLPPRISRENGGMSAGR
mgnify:CR=1 FL=1